MKVSLKAAFLCLSASVGAIVASQPAIAQSAQNDTSEEGNLGEIIVTARRSNENLQTVPVAVSVLSGDTLEKQRITGARDLQYNTPSLVVSSDPLGGSTAPVFQIRGLEPSQGSDDTVVTYVGDVPVNSRAFAGGLFDLQSVQVLRGPQGTLFGKNSTGGAVLFTPRMADAQSVSGFVDGTVGNYSYYQIGAGVNMPLVQDKLGLRVSGQITRQNGFTRNLSGPDGNDKHYEVLRASLVATPTENLKNETLINYFHGRQHQNPLITTAAVPGLVSFLEGIGVAAPGTGAAFAQQFQRQQQLGPRTIDYSFNTNYNNSDTIIITNATSYDFGGVTLKNIFGYTHLKSSVSLSQSSTNAAIVDVAKSWNEKAVSDELQLSGETSGLKWIVGGFYSHDKTNTVTDAWVFGIHTNNTLGGDKYVSKALFGQITYDFSGAGLNGVKLNAGLRHSWDKREGTNLVGNYTPGGAIVLSPPQSGTVKFNEWSWTVGLDYQVSDSTLLYVTSRHSYKAGGINLVSSTVPAALFTFNPEKMTDIEVGVKTTLHLGGDSVVRMNVAGYRGWYKNMHQQELAFCNGNTGSYVINAGDGDPKGVEFEFDASLTRNFRVSGFYNRNLGKFNRFAFVQPDGCAVIGAGADLVGQDFGRLVKDSASLSATYTIPLKGDGEALELSGNWYYRSKKVGDFTAGNNSGFPGYSLFNARVDYNNIGGTNFSAGVWVRNIGDKLYTTYRNEVLGLTGYDSRTYGDPRTFGMDVKYRF